MAVEVRPMYWWSVDRVNKVCAGFSDENFLGMLHLPLQGSGAVRDLHEAMSLGTGGIAGVKKHSRRCC